MPRRAKNLAAEEGGAKAVADRAAKLAKHYGAVGPNGTAAARSLRDAAIVARHAAGSSQQEIASEMGIAVRTVQHVLKRFRETPSPLDERPVALFEDLLRTYLAAVADLEGLAFHFVDVHPHYQSWRRRAFKRALAAAEVEHARPYDLRHSFASLLLHEGRSVIYVARQLGHDARLTLSTYGHVMDELEGAESRDAEAAIRAAREGAGTRLVPAEPSEGLK